MEEGQDSGTGRVSQEVRKGASATARVVCWEGEWRALCAHAHVFVHAHKRAHVGAGVRYALMNLTAEKIHNIRIHNLL
jgi:hypothetical protein